MEGQRSRAGVTGQKCRDRMKVRRRSSPVREIDAMAYEGAMVFQGISGYFKVFRPARSESVRAEVRRNKEVGGMRQEIDGDGVRKGGWLI
jgi:hypothetical protein